METITEIEIKKIFPNPNQPRKEFDKIKLKELADSIKANGLINPIQVKQVGNKYQLICGERRWRAHKLLKIKKIKSIIKTYSNKESEMIESLVENLQRGNLNSIEKENYITMIWETGNYKTRTELARAIGLSDSWVMENIKAKKIREQTKVTSVISTRTISNIQYIKNIEDRKKILKKIVNKELQPSEVKKYSDILNKSPTDVKQALIKNKISLVQANNISKISDKGIRKKLILAHKEIKNIDKGLETAIGIKKLRNKHKILKIKETINSFRQSAIESQKINQTTIQNLMKCMQLIDLMDEEQLNKLKYYQNLFETNIINLSILIENLKKKIEQIN